LKERCQQPQCNEDEPEEVLDGEEEIASTVSVVAAAGIAKPPPQDEQEEPTPIQVTKEEVSSSRRRRVGRSSVVRVKRERPDTEEQMDLEETEEPSIDPGAYLEQLIKKEGGTEQEDRKPFAQRATQAAGLPQEVVMVTRTTRGKELLVFQGFTFLRGDQQIRTEGGQQVLRWKCTNSYSS